jgi:hypothetical protein
MIEIGVLKNFDSETYKAGVQLAGSLTTYFDGVSVAKNIPSSAMVIGNYVILAIPGGNPKDACVIATWPQGSPGGGAFLDLSDTPSSYEGQAGKLPKVNDGEDALEFSKITGSNLSQTFGASGLRLLAWNLTAKQGLIFRVDNAASSPFSGKINGAPSATEVVYDNEVNENCLKNLGTGADRWGRFVLHNTTRGNSRLITDFDETIKKIYTESSADDWADDDDITLQSQTCTQAGYMDVDLSNELSSDEIVAYINIEATDKSGAEEHGRRIIAHPYESYDMGKRRFNNLYLAGEKTSTAYLIPIISQRLCVMFDDCSDVGTSITVMATLEYADT